MPRPGAIDAFRAILAGEGVPVYLRRPRGRDIYAACGQLKRTLEENGNSRGRQPDPNGLASCAPSIDRSRSKEERET
jgi:hypothetical protein